LRPQTAIVIFRTSITASWKRWRFNFSTLPPFHPWIDSQEKPGSDSVVHIEPRQRSVDQLEDGLYGRAGSFMQPHCGTDG
jgi:hypothetical protein